MTEPPPDWHVTPHRWVRIEDGPKTWRTCALCGSGPNARIHRDISTDTEP